MSTPALYRKKPITVQALQFDGTAEGLVAVSAWMTAHGHAGMGGIEGESKVLRIETLEGTLTASPGDWIIRGISGEFYPCKPDIFAATYEAA